MKNKILYFLTLIVLTTFTSCEEAAEPTGISFITFSTPSESFIIDEGTTLNTEFKIYTATNVGSDTTLDLNVTTTLDAANYTLPATVTMPANSNEVTVSLSITENNLDKINGETLSISFSSPDGFYSGSTTLDIVVNVFCPSAIAGSYVYGDGNGKAATISAGNGVNNFIVSGDNGFGTDYPFYINDQCGSITVTGGVLPDDFGIPNSGTGTVQANGDIVITYTVDGYFADRTMTLVKQ
ncbi:hypothetical protein [Polaribacter sp.]|uniref:hypothetical protein n=1 Tax=Polaribacter sp. TaxID=1920175 RepID=UPI003F6D26C4